MTDDKLQEFKDYLKQRHEDITEQYGKQAAAIELEKNPNVMLYLKVCGARPLSESITVDSREGLAVRAFHSFVGRIPYDETNGVFVYSGTYRVDANGYRRTNYSSPSAEYRKYWDIEQEDPIYIQVEDCERFEQEHTILVGSMDSIRKTFIETSLAEGQAKALTLINTKFKHRNTK